MIFFLTFHAFGNIKSFKNLILLHVAISPPPFEISQVPSHHEETTKDYCWVSGRYGIERQMSEMVK